MLSEKGKPLQQYKPLYLCVCARTQALTSSHARCDDSYIRRARLPGSTRAGWKHLGRKLISYAPLSTRLLGTLRHRLLDLRSSGHVTCRSVAGEAPNFAFWDVNCQFHTSFVHLMRCEMDADGFGGTAVKREGDALDACGRSSPFRMRSQS